MMRKLPSSRVQLLKLLNIQATTSTLPRSLASGNSWMLLTPIFPLPTVKLTFPSLCPLRTYSPSPAAAPLPPAELSVDSLRPAKKLKSLALPMRRERQLLPVSRCSERSSITLRQATTSALFFAAFREQRLSAARFFPSPVQSILTPSSLARFTF